MKPIEMRELSVSSQGLTSNRQLLCFVWHEAQAYYPKIIHDWEQILCIFKFFYCVKEKVTPDIHILTGFLESLDDFYLMSNGLVMLQTTNNVFNTSLYDLVQAHSVPAWIRVRVANQKSTKSSEWGPWLEKYNSGMCPALILIHYC